MQARLREGLGTNDRPLAELLKGRAQPLRHPPPPRAIAVGGQYWGMSAGQAKKAAKTPFRVIKGGLA